MDEIKLISTPISEAWTLWFMFFLLVCLVLVEVLQPDTLRTVFRTTFTKLERTYGDRAQNFLGFVLLNIFRVGTLAMTMYVFTYQNAPFSMLTFGIVIAVILGIVTVKSLFSWLVSYTFELRRTVAAYLPQYGNIWTLLCVLLYPVTLLYISASQSIVLYWTPFVMMGLFLALVAYKLMQYFYNGPRSILYLAIYLVTLELLPLGVIVVTVSALT